MVANAQQTESPISGELAARVVATIQSGRQSLEGLRDLLANCDDEQGRNIRDGYHLVAHAGPRGQELFAALFDLIDRGDDFPADLSLSDAEAWWTVQTVYPFLAEPFAELVRMIGVADAVGRLIGQTDDDGTIEGLLIQSGRHITALQAKRRKDRRKRRGK